MIMITGSILENRTSDIYETFSREAVEPDIVQIVGKYMNLSKRIIFIKEIRNFGLFHRPACRRSR